MPNTGERREVKRYVNAKENETVQEAKKLVSKTKQQSAKSADRSQSRERRKEPSTHTEKPHGTKDQSPDKEASERMVSEGDPILDS